MTKEEIIKDIKFRQRCGEYGLNWEDFEIYFGSILLNTPTEGLYVVFDKNYNTTGIVNLNSQGTLIYTKSNYPFEGFTLKQIIDLSNIIDILETNHGHSLSTRINGIWYDRDSQENEEYFQLLSYIKFLGEEIQKYFLLSYHMQTIGFEVPDVFSYVRNLTSKVNNCIDNHLLKNERPMPSDILSYIGQNHRELNMDGILNDVIDLLIKDKGYQVKKDSPFKVEKINTKKKDLSIIASSLLEILELNYEDLKVKEEIDSILRRTRRKDNNN